MLAKSRPTRSLRIEPCFVPVLTGLTCEATVIMLTTKKESKKATTKASRFVRCEGALPPSPPPPPFKDVPCPEPCEEAAQDQYDEELPVSYDALPPELNSEPAERSEGALEQAWIS